MATRSCCEHLLNADVAAAEQVAWSLQSLTSHLNLLDRRLSAPLNAAVDSLFAELERPDAFDGARFVERLEELGAAMR